MRTTQYLLATLKEKPSCAESMSHQLMLRAGMIRQLASGLYTWLPTGLRVLKKVENIVREEMQKAGGVEISMPIVQPAKLWKRSRRWDQYGAELLRLMDRNHRFFVMGPTHEEVITDLMRKEIHSYKQLPINVFQIQTKFRDEVRPRCGVMRAREFLMKDGYSFHINQDSLEHTYSIMYNTYSNILRRMDLNFCVVEADSGSIGGCVSHEFQVLASSGDNNIAFSTVSEYAANIEIAKTLPPTAMRSPPTQKKIQFSAPDLTTDITSLATHGNFSITNIVQTFVVKASQESDHELVVLLIRGDHEINKIKAESIDIVSAPLMFATDQEVRQYILTGLGSIGPVGISIPIIADRSVSIMSDFIVGANVDGQYLSGVNWERDLPLPRIEDIRNIVEGDLSPDGQGTLLLQRGIEVGHIFQLGTKYSQAFKALVQDNDGSSQILRMGCYGIGISRIVAAAIEQNHDQRGIIWSPSLAPFQVAIVPVSVQQSPRIRCIAEDLYHQLLLQGIDVILDDRIERPGVMFSEMDLIGIPHLLIINDRSANHEVVECQSRALNQKHILKISEIFAYLTASLKLPRQMRK
ncbi:Proline--tRNA ligase [Candidatus Erwinia haradaeae]|uniref:Proline--tRNA ligase n=1 Tax=Candidatus Erwinia haradaeae TaxID=1922217 RepID=A0A451DCI7_9GAMM|nr:proline--tRNA ligase [Candidatus Erwinia haradaeae]VFP84064.1 Proline--tRNA ligase [Candidatus Erwinia haradaeae]